MRHRMQGKLIALDRAIAQAKSIDGPVIFTDAADATSSGASGDSNAIIKALQAAGYGKRVLVQIVDAPAAAAAHKAGVGTEVAKGKETKVFDGHEYVMERGLVGDLALVKAWKGDASGNLVYRKAARNFNPMMATAAKICVAEVEELVPVGALDPDHIHTPGIFVNRILCGAPYDKKIEQRTIRKA